MWEKVRVEVSVSSGFRNLSVLHAVGRVLFHGRWGGAVLCTEKSMVSVSDVGPTSQVLITQNIFRNCEVPLSEVKRALG